MKDTIWDKIRYKYWDIIPYDYRPGQLWYLFKCWAWKRYTTIKPRYLPHTWCDRDNVLLHTCFEILSQFIERECQPEEIVNWEASGHTVIVNGKTVNVRREMQTLYDWWHNDYHKRYPKLEERIWKIIEKHRPIKNEIPLDENMKETTEENAKYYKWEQTFKTKHDNEMYHRNMDRLIKLEIAVDNKCQKMLHRLINIRQYMWT